MRRRILHLEHLRFSNGKEFDEHGRVRFHHSEYAMPIAGPGHADGGSWSSAGHLLKFFQALKSGKLSSDVALRARGSRHPTCSWAIPWAALTS